MTGAAFPHAPGSPEYQEDIRVTWQAILMRFDGNLAAADAALEAAITAGFSFTRETPEATATALFEWRFRT